MAKLGVNTQFKAKSVYDANKLTLKLKEVARVCVIEQDPAFDYMYVHRISIKGDNKRSGYFKCLGNWDIVFRDGSDPDNCEGCKKGHKVEWGESGVTSATRRLATNIIKYITDPKGIPRNPPMADCIVWIINDKKYNRLADIATEYGSLQTLDLVVSQDGTQESFQNMTIDPARNCLWRTNEQIAREIVGVWKANRIDDLEPLLGTEISPERLGQLIAEATGQQVFGTTGNGGQAPLASPQDLQDLLGASMPSAQSSQQATLVPSMTIQQSPPQAAPAMVVPAAQPIPPPPPAKALFAEEPVKMPKQPSPTMPPTNSLGVDFDELLKLS